MGGGQPVSTELPKRFGAAQTEVAPEYHPLGPNHSLRINGVAYFYEPNTDRWERGTVTAEQMDYAYWLTAEDIMLGQADGSMHVAVWVAREVTS